MTIALGAAVPSLARWGMSGDADLVFRTLATFGPMSASQLASELGLHRQRVETALDELHERHAVVPSAELSARRSPLWASRPPAEVVGALRSHRVRMAGRSVQARRHREILTTFGSRLSEVGIPAEAALGGTQTTGVRLLRTRPLARERIAELAAEERHEHLAINTEAVPDAASRAVGSPLMRQMKARGVRSRTLARPPDDGDRLTQDADVIDGDYFQLRELPEVPLKLFVFDRRTALFPVDALDFERGYFEVSTPQVVAGLIELFERHWRAAVNPQLDAVPLIVLSARERDLVDLLAQGHTDCSAARKMQISARSVTYTLRALMDRMGVENRFQLGLALGAMRVAVPPSMLDRN